MYFQYREHKSLPRFAVLVPFQAGSECANLVIPVKDAFTLKDGAVTMLTKRFLHVVRQLRFILHIDETSRCIAKSAILTQTRLWLSHRSNSWTLQRKNKNNSTLWKLHGGFLKWWYPQIIHFNRDFHYKPSILG